MKLTQYSHGAGCGCKIAPNVLERILSGGSSSPAVEALLVGNEASDDAAVFDLGNGTAVISTTDFFMPIVDDPADFGRIAAANALSDVYAMGGKPLMAIAILGWPLDKLSADVARQVVDGGRETCRSAGIPLAGGHSIDSPEPIFGLAATGLVDSDRLLRNDTGVPGDLLLLSKPLGIGILTTAEKKGLLPDELRGVAATLMKHLNSAGAELGGVDGVHAVTDVTGFGLMGHLIEMCGTQLDAEIEWPQIPTAAELEPLIHQGCVPGGTHRNWASYGAKVDELNDIEKALLCDPQTSGGLLVATSPDSLEQVQAVLHHGHNVGALHPIGRLTERSKGEIRIHITR